MSTNTFGDGADELDDVGVVGQAFHHLRFHAQLVDDLVVGPVQPQGLEHLHRHHRPTLPPRQTGVSCVSFVSLSRSYRLVVPILALVDFAEGALGQELAQSEVLSINLPVKMIYLVLGNFKSNY